MRTGITRARLLTRLERLECRVAVEPQGAKIRMGHLKRLPRHYFGERHIVIAKLLPDQDGQEWVEYEERPGPDPNPPQNVRGVPQYLDIMLVEAYPPAEDAT